MRAFNVGSVFTLDVGAPPFCSANLTSGKVGTVVGILGQVGGEVRWGRGDVRHGGWCWISDRGGSRGRGYWVDHGDYGLDYAD